MESLESEDLFKASFKHFKSRVNPINFSEVIDFKNFAKKKNKSVSKCRRLDTTDDESSSKTCDASSQYAGHDSKCGARTIELDPTFANKIGQVEYGLKEPSEWLVYELDDIPGFQFISNPFRDSCAHDFWITKCLTEYPKKPNISNLDAHTDRQSDLWSEFVKEMDSGAKVRDTNFFKLRWVTLGYHYDWNTKLYYKDRHTDFPSDLYGLSAYVAKCLGYENYRAEAGIVNFYHLDSTLAGHTDHSEFDMDSPLFSISFGCDAIFLIGSETKATKPVAVYLRSGDIVVMAGKSRLAYHAVPKIIGPKDDSTSSSVGHGQKWMHEYMAQSRININIRQVLKEGQEFPDTSTGKSVQ